MYLIYSLSGMSSSGIQEECLGLKVCFRFIIRTGILGRMEKRKNKAEQAN